MLRVGTTPPSEMGMEERPNRFPAPQTNHYGQTTSRFEPHETPNPTTRSPRNSIEGNNSTHRQHQWPQQPAPSFSAKRPNAPSLPPSRGHSAIHYQNMALTGDRLGGNSPGGTGGRRSSSPRTPSTSSPRRAQSPVDTTPKSAAQSRLGFLASSVTAFTARMTSPTQPPARTDDELCDLDIEAALFPGSGSGSAPAEGEAFSPAAYKNLQANATGLLHRMQDAYRQRTLALRELQAEREAQREEMEEMELRARHFKTQLEAMAAKAAEQEAAMQQLVASVQAERRARADEEQQRRGEGCGEKMLFRTGGEGSVTEDLCVDDDDDERKQRWRASNSTVKSDLSIDTDADSAESASIFSRSRSPTAMTIATEIESVDVPPTPGLSPGLQPRAALPVPRPKSAQQLSAFQRLVKGISASAIKEEHEGARGGVDGCRNCRGQDASVAWDTVSLLRDENSALKQRVAHLDVVVEGALDVVNGIGI